MAKAYIFKNEKSQTTVKPKTEQSEIEVIDSIEGQNLDFKLGNALKYICRANHRGQFVADLQKAIWYLQRSLDKSTLS